MRHRLARPGMAQGNWVFLPRALWLVLGLSFFSSTRYAECLCSANDSRVLLAWKGKNQLDALSSWKPGADCCHGWAGVTCDASATHVIALNLTIRPQLKSVHFPRDVCYLQALQSLNISLGSFSGDGDIPACLWNMTKMRYLSISSMPFIVIGSFSYSYGEQRGLLMQGSLSAQVCSLTHLTHLDIGGIDFVNPTIPDCLWTMTQLEYLTLSSGGSTIPTFSQVCNLRNLTHLDVSSDFPTVFHMEIPSCIWKMTKLEFLSLLLFRKPSLISFDVCNMNGLTYLNLANSNVYGDIPSCIWNLTHLEHLSWAPIDFPPRFPLSVSLSSHMCTLRNLSYLSIQFSTASGYVPACLWNMTRLEVLELLPPYLAPYKPENEALHLPGSFSPQLCRLSRLRRFALPYLDITGVLPACIWKMPQLEHLDLSGLDLSTMEYPSEVFAPSLTEFVS